MATSSKSGAKPAKATVSATKAPAKAAKKATGQSGPKPAVGSSRAKATAPSAMARKPAATRKPAAVPELTPEQRRCYVEVAAYYIAERRGFEGGGQVDDWVRAEAEIDRLLREGILKP